MNKLSKILSFNDFLNEDNLSNTANTAIEINKNGFAFTQKMKKIDDTKPEWKHMPCYQYVYNFIKEYIPNLNPLIVNDFKMAYKKDINKLLSTESYKLAKDALQVPTMPETMRGLEYVNNKYKLGTIVPVEQAKVGDAINFWVFEFIEFNRNSKDGEMGTPSYSDTKTKLAQYIKANNIDINKLPEWLIEGILLKYGHYGIISAIDDKYLYLSSSGEKRGCNGIWNGVPKEECSENFTKVLKSDLHKFQNLSYDKMLFQSTDTLSNNKTQLVMRSYILNFIK